MAKISIKQKIDEVVERMTIEQLMAWAIKRDLAEIIEEHIIADYEDWDENEQKEYLKEITDFVNMMKQG